MVILSRGGDSDTTLVGLVDDQQEQNKFNADLLVHHDDATDIGLPGFDDDSDCGSDLFSGIARPERSTSLRINAKSTLSLPTSPSASCDAHLTSDSADYQQLVESSKRSLCGREPVRFDAHSTDERIVYVDQREVAHATQSQTDWLVTHHATTCHMLAIRSTSSNAQNQPLSTLTHIDSVECDACVRDILEKHASFHGSHNNSDIQMDIHLVGGFVEDEHSSNITQESRALTDCILNGLADFSLATDMVMNLRTCLVSTANTRWNGGPMIRGVALQTSTGLLVPVDRVDEDLCGPKPHLRQARLWSCEPSVKPHLTLIHDRGNDAVFTIQPFTYSWNADLEWLSRLPSDLHLLHYTSTSPQYEDPAEFCTMIRSTLSYMKRNRDAQPNSTLLTYKRVGMTNRWEPVSKTPTPTSLKQ